MISFAISYFSLLNPMPSRTLGVMFKVKQPFTKNFLLLSHITLFLVHCNSLEIIRPHNLKSSKSYQNNQVMSIKKLLRVPDSFTL